MKLELDASWRTDELCSLFVGQSVLCHVISNSNVVSIAFGISVGVTQFSLKQD